MGTLSVIAESCIVSFIIYIYIYAYEWLATYEDNDNVKLPSAIAEELFGAFLVLPLAVGYMRWPVSTNIVAADATPSAGGACEARVSEQLAEALYSAGEVKGAYVRMQGLGTSLGVEYEPVDNPLVVDIARAVPWRTCSSHAFAETPSRTLTSNL